MSPACHPHSLEAGASLTLCELRHTCRGQGQARRWHPAVTSRPSTLSSDKGAEDERDSGLQPRVSSFSSVIRTQSPPSESLLRIFAQFSAACPSDLGFNASTSLWTPGCRKSL